MIIVSVYGAPPMLGPIGLCLLVIPFVIAFVAAVFIRTEKGQYCGASGKLTLDHVVPRCRGGRSVWENVVASCPPCNLRKGDRLPAEARMHPHAKPRVPSAVLFVTLAASRVPERWHPYLGAGLLAPATA